MKGSSGSTIGVFKPIDEDSLSIENPKSNENKCDVVGIQSGESAYREVAAYLIDDEKFFGVPKTALVQLSPTKKFKNRTKVGSLQEFVENDGASWDIGSNVFPVDEVHKIGILDLYTLNFDRHGGNILFKEDDEDGISLIPIDNGFSLPDTFAIPNLWFEWMSWSQSKKPFNQKTVAFIENLNVEKHIETIRSQLNIRSECLKIMTLMGYLLKKSVAAGLTLHDIGSLLCPVGKSPSPIVAAYGDKVEDVDFVKMDHLISSIVSKKCLIQ